MCAPGPALLGADDEDDGGAADAVGAGAGIVGLPDAGEALVDAVGLGVGLAAGVAGGVVVPDGELATVESWALATGGVATA